MPLEQGFAFALRQLSDRAPRSSSGRRQQPGTGGGDLREDLDHVVVPAERCPGRRVRARTGRCPESRGRRSRRVCPTFRASSWNRNTAGVMAAAEGNLAECGHDRPPAVPGLWPAVDEDDRRAATAGHVVHTDTVDLGELLPESVLERGIAVGGRSVCSDLVSGRCCRRSSGPRFATVLHAPMRRSSSRAAPGSAVSVPPS